MAPLPDNLTGRLWIHYTSAGEGHELLIRTDPGVSASLAAGHGQAIANILKAGMSTSDAFDSARFSAAGSNLSFPVAWTVVVGTVAGAVDPDKGANFIALSARTTGGRRSKFTFFTPTATPDTLGYRQGMGGYFADFRDYVEENAAQIVGIDGEELTIYGYTNQGYNAYWQRQLRA